MKAHCTFLLCLGSSLLSAQKPPLTYSAIETWPRINLESPVISHDGQYVAYSVDVPKTGTTLTVRAVDREWQRALAGGSAGSFTADDHYFVFQSAGDSVGVLSLAHDSVRYIGAASEYIVPKHGSGAWFAYQRRDSAGMLVLHNLNTGDEQIYRGVSGYLLSDSGTTLVVQIAAESSRSQALVWVDLRNGRRLTVAHGRAFYQLIFDATQSALAFVAVDSLPGREQVALGFYASGMDSARTLVDVGTPGMSGLAVTEIRRFSRDGKDLFVDVGPMPSRRSGSDTGAHVAVFDSHRDRSMGTEPFLAVVHVNTAPRVVRLQQALDKDYAWGFGKDDAYVFVFSNVVGNDRDYKWRIAARPDLYMVSTRDGSRTLLGRRFVGDQLEPRLSPGGRYAIWFDRGRRSWFTYSIRAKQARNVTRRVSAPMYWPEDHPDLPRSFDVVGWLPDDERVLLQSVYDIWAIDPSGEKPPINLTQGVGARRKIRFRWIDFHTEDRGGDQALFRFGDTLILSAFDETTKENGFYRLVLDGHRRLTPLLVESKAFHVEAAVLGERGMRPLKAERAARYLLSAESATEYPNLYVTSDFQNLSPITQFAPQREYNWYRAELVHWRLPDGRAAEGLLYKPEDFDPRLRYPVVIYYYEQFADGLNVFVHPELSGGWLNAPWFASHGYLVFVPNISYTDGYPGRSALNTVVSGAVYLARFPWVNARKMGLQGHSFGGFETYYIVTHTSRFAAAAPAEGITEVVSNYTIGIGGPRFYELRQGRIGATLWEHPDLYFENSPILRADHVTTPLLVLANAGDHNVPGWYGREMFVALMRLGKTAWLLDYAGEDHTLEQRMDRLDYSIRLEQFFDYYLKDAPAAAWMKNGVTQQSKVEPLHAASTATPSRKPPLNKP